MGKHAGCRAEGVAEPAIRTDAEGLAADPEQRIVLPNERPRDLSDSIGFGLPFLGGAGLRPDAYAGNGFVRRYSSDSDAGRTRKAGRDRQGVSAKDAAGSE